MDPVGNPITNYVFRHSIYDFWRLNESIDTCLRVV